MGDGRSTAESHYILAESGKMIDPTTEQIDEEEDEMRETSHLMGNSTSQVVSDRKKVVEVEKPKPKTNNLIPKPIANLKPI